MERRIAPKERERGGTTKEYGNGDAMRSCPASEQLSTRSCARCSGLLVNEWYCDIHNSGTHHLETFRCIQCGHRVDPVILQNQVRLQVERQSVRQVRPRYSTRTGLLSELS
jgi:hypothetical protein